MDEDLRAGRVRHAEPEWREVFRVAEELSAEHTETVGVASVDVWHVASTIRLRADTFWTFDLEQSALAKATKCFRVVL